MSMSLLITLSTVAISIACVAIAAFMLWHQRKGWGWFLFVGFLVCALLPDVPSITWH
jgi:hypothetical protein